MLPIAAILTAAALTGILSTAPNDGLCRRNWNQYRPISETKERWKWRLAQIQFCWKPIQSWCRRAGLWARRRWWYHCMYRLPYGCHTAKSLVRSRTVRINQKPHIPSGNNLGTTKIHPPSFFISQYDNLPDRRRAMSDVVISISTGNRATWGNKTRNRQIDKP